MLVIALGWCAAQEPDKPKEVVATFAGHQETVYGVALSGDGKQLLTASFDKSIKLWDVASAKELRTFGGEKGHQNLVLDVAFAPDGQTFASAGSDNSVKIWDVPLAKAIRELACNDAVTAITTTVDGKSIAAGGKDGVIIIWNTPDAKESFRLTGHVGAVTALAYSANGQLLASTGIDQTLRFWNPANGQVVAVLGAHPSAVTGLALSPNGNAAYTSGADGTLKTWQLPPVASRPLAGHNDIVQALALSADGTLAVTGCADKNVRVFQFDNGQIARTLTAPEAVKSVALAGAGKTALVAAGTAGGQLVVWGADAKPVFQGPAHAKEVTGLSAQPNGNGLLSVGGDGVVKFWPVPIAAKTAKQVAADVRAAMFVGDAQVALASAKDKTIKLVDLNSGKDVKSIATLPEAAAALALSKDNQQIAAGFGKQIKVWNIADGKEVQTLNHPAAVTTLSFSPDRTRLITGTTDNLARVWDLTTGKELQAFSHGAAVTGVAFHPTKPANVISTSADKTAAVHTLTIQRTIVVSPTAINSIALTPNGQSILTGCEDKSVKMWNLANGNAERTFAGATAAVLAVAVSRNNNLVAVASADKLIRLYNMADGALIGSFPAPGVVRTLSFHPNGLALLSGGDDKTITAWNIAFQPGNPPPPEFGKPIQTFGVAGNVLAATYSNDGNTLLSASDDKAARVWKTAAEGPTKNFQHPNFVDAVAFNKDGSQLATGCHDGILRIFDVVKAAPLKQINAHNQPQPSAIYAVAWSPDFKQIATGSFDKSIKIWDAAAGTLVKEIKGLDEKTSPKGHHEGVFSVAFSPDGKQIISGSSDRTIKVWNVADGAMLREFVNPNLPSMPPQAHPGWIYHLRFTPDGSKVVSVGGAPRNKGYIAVWNFADGKMLYGAEMPLGLFYHLAIMPDGTTIAVACGPRGPHGRQIPQAEAVLLRLPVK